VRGDKRRNLGKVEIHGARWVSGDEAFMGSLRGRHDFILGLVRAGFCVTTGRQRQNEERGKQSSEWHLNRMARPNDLRRTAACGSRQPWQGPGGGVQWRDNEWRVVE
jgi:hypothetical protein